MQGAKVLSLKQLKQKKYVFLSDIPEPIVESFGRLTSNFIMLIWGSSGNGKSNLVIQLLKVLMLNGRILYVSLEEGHEASMQLTAIRHLGDECCGKILFADSSMNYEKLFARLKRKRSEQFIVIDSVQYFDIDYNLYKRLKESFPNKSFIFISHAKGKNPDGKTAEKIRYDAPIKVRVEGFVANVVSRFGGNKPYVIWIDGAKKYWKEKFKTITK